MLGTRGLLASILNYIPKPTASTMSNNSGIAPRINIFGNPLAAAPVGVGGVATGFFRNSYCDASPMDRASHTVAAIVTPEFLEYSASAGNDLRSLWPTSGPNTPGNRECVWCLCAVRWKQALTASLTHPLGEKIVPRVYLESSHIEALKSVEKVDLERFGVGGNGDGESCKNDDGNSGMNGADRVAR